MIAMTFSNPSRRALMSGLGGLALATSAGQLAFARSTGQKKIVLVILRGAMDGLAAVAPYADPHYRPARGRLALSLPGEVEGVLPIAEGFGLHPRLEFLHAEWRAAKLAILHAACSPYRGRSHFDGQDVLENGGDTAFGLRDGWMNRALGLLPATASPKALAIGLASPTVLRGSTPYTSWTPPTQPDVPDSTIARLTDLYAGDTLLSPALAMALETSALVETQATEGLERRRGAGGLGGYRTLTQAAARILSAPGGPAAAVISLDGWDTHANQGAASGSLALRLQSLDAALASLKQDLGSTWHDTVVIVATEFGRTVSANGTGGTDHGAGGAAFLLGGSVRGGRMLGDWPGLAPAALLDGRDLSPVNDLRALFAGVLNQQWGLEAADLRSKVFSGGSPPSPLSGLIA